MKLKFFISCLFLLAQMVLFGQNHYFFSKFTANDGLPSTKTYFTFQDSRGYIWISTNSGLSRYDGHNFRNYNIMDGLEASMILTIQEDGENRLWIATDKGTNIFNGKKFLDLPGFRHSCREMLFQSDTAYLSTHKGLFIYKDSILQEILTEESGLESSKITALLKSKDTIFIGTDKGISTLSNGKIRPFWNSGYIMSMVEDQQGTVWFCTLNGEVFYYKDQRFNKLDHSEEGKHNTFKMMVNKEGDIVLMHGQHLSVYRGTELYYRVDNFIENQENVITDVMEDIEGNLWISSIRGLYIGKKTRIKNISFPQKSITHMFISDFSNDLYAVGYKNIYKIKGDSIYEEVFKDKPPQLGELNFVSEYKKGEFLFAATIGGLIQYKNGKYLKLTDGFVYVNSLFKEENEIWICHKNAFSQFENDSLRAFPLQIPPFDPPLYFNIVKLNKEDKLVSSNAGLFKFSTGEIKKLSFSKEHDRMPFFKKILKADDGSFFIGTKGNGLFNVSIEKDLIKVNYIINSKNSILNDDIIDFIIDDNKNLWLTSTAGLYKIYNIHSEDQYIEYLGQEEGIPAHSWSFSSLLNDHRGNIYLSGSEGISRIPIELTAFSPEIQTTRISSIKVLGEDFNWEMDDSLLNFEGLPADYTFAHQENALTFYFTGINFYKPQKVLYQYQLEGLEKGWTSSSTNFASYNNLPPGDYTFKVRSGTNILTVDKEPLAFFNFTIAPPYWKTWWFNLLVSFIVAALIYSFYRYRLNEQIQKQKMQMQVSRQLNENKMMAFQARMNPHFVFNSLNSIQYFITNNDKVSTLTYLSKFAKLLRQIVDNSIQTKVSLEIEIEMLKSYIEMEELRFDKNFSFEIAVDEGLDASNIEIPAMILQPFVENAILHGLLHRKEGGKLHISFKKGKKQVICAIEDNGIGRLKSEKLNKLKHRNHQSQGTKIAMKRLELLSNSAEDLHNSVEFVDLYDNDKAIGTRVILKIPIL